MFSFLNTFLKKNKKQSQPKTKSISKSKPAPKPKVTKTVDSDKQKAELKNLMHFTQIVLGTENQYDNDLIVKSGGKSFPLLFNKLFKGAASREKLGFLVFAMGSFKSVRIYKTLIKYAKEGYQITIFTNLDKALEEKEILELEGFKGLPNVHIVQTRRAISNVQRMSLALNLMNVNYCMLLSANDVLNHRSFITNIEDIITNNPDSDVLIPNSYSSLSNIKEGWNFNQFSGYIFKTEVLKELLGTFSPEIQFELTSEFSKLIESKNVSKFDEFAIFKHYDYENITLADLGQIGNYYLSKISDEQEQTYDTLESYLLVLTDVYSRYALSQFKQILLTILTAYLLYKSEVKGINVESYKEKFNQFLDFGIDITTANYKRIFEQFIKNIPIRNDVDILITENIGMEDINNSILIDKLKENFSVRYILKRSNFDYYNLNNMILKLHSKDATVVIANGSLNYEMLAPDVNHLTLWHGLGWLKKTVVKPKKFTVGTIVCSSNYCAPRYKEHFFANDSLPLGSFQTDCLFDEQFKKSIKAEIKQKYNIPNDGQIIFFAPTFRIGKEHQYYNFGMDIEALSEKLAEKKFFLITKRHHVFESIKQDKGIDASGVYTSKNKHFIVDDQYSFNEIICCADTFVTDYSSGIYYAFVLDLPIFLYALDIEEYKNGANGFEINYPTDIPIPLVNKPNIEDFINAVNLAKDAVQTDVYKEYKYDNVGSCDGNVCDRIITYLYNKYFSSKAIPEYYQKFIKNDEILNELFSDYTIEISDSFLDNKHIESVTPEKSEVAEVNNKDNDTDTGSDISNTKDQNS